MVKKIILIASVVTTSITSFNAQSNLLEHIPTNEFAVITFDGAAINSKSTDFNQLAIHDSIIVNFDRLLNNYKQAIIDENTSVSDEEVEILREEVEIMETAPPPPPPKSYNDEATEEVEEIEESIDIPVEIEDNYNYDYNSNSYYKPTPRLTLENIFGGLMSNGAQYGVNNNSKYYFIVGVNDSINHTALLFSKGDTKKFDTFINNIVPKEQQEELIKLNNGYQYYSDDDIMIVWNNDIVTFIDYTIPYNYYNEVEEAVDENYYESYKDRLEAEAKKKELEKKAKLESVLNNIFNNNPQHSLKFNANYKKSLIEKGDVTFFINALGNNSDIFFKAYSNSRAKTEDFLSLFKDNFSYGSLNFNNNNVSLNSTQHVGAHYLKQIKEVNKKKFNKSMYKYIDGENLMGIVGFASNMKPAYEIYKDMYINILTNMDFGEDWIGTAADIGFTFFDEEELFDLIQGDFVFAVTDIKEFEVEYTSYDYDDDYNRIESIKTKKETLPEFVSVATIGNEELRNKIIKLMMQTDVIRKKGNYYELQEPKSRYSKRAAKPLNIFYMIKDDLLIVTNDESLLKDNNGNGLPKAQQINGEAYKLMKSNNMFAYWTPKGTYEKVPAQFSADIEPLESLANTYKSIELQGVSNKGNLFTTSAKINLIDNSKGSLMISLEMINELIKTAGRF